MQQADHVGVGTAVVLIVARSAYHDVVAVAADELVVTVTAIQDVVAVPAVEDIVARITPEDVHAVVAVEGHAPGGRAAVPHVSDDIGAGSAPDHQISRIGQGRMLFNADHVPAVAQGEIGISTRVNNDVAQLAIARKGHLVVARADELVHHPILEGGVRVVARGVQLDHVVVGFGAAGTCGITGKGIAGLGIEGIKIVIGIRAEGIVSRSGVRSPKGIETTGTGAVGISRAAKGVEIPRARTKGIGIAGIRSPKGIKSTWAAEGIKPTAGSRSKGIPRSRTTEGVKAPGATELGIKSPTGAWAKGLSRSRAAKGVEAAGAAELGIKSAAGTRSWAVGISRTAKRIEITGRTRAAELRSEVLGPAELGTEITARAGIKLSGVAHGGESAAGAEGVCAAQWGKVTGATGHGAEIPSRSRAELPRIPQGCKITRARSYAGAKIAGSSRSGTEVTAGAGAELSGIGQGGKSLIRAGSEPRIRAGTKSRCRSRSKARIWPKAGIRAEAGLIGKTRIGAQTRVRTESAGLLAGNPGRSNAPLGSPRLSRSCGRIKSTRAVGTKLGIQIRINLVALGQPRFSRALPTFAFKPQRCQRTSPLRAGRIGVFLPLGIGPFPGSGIFLALCFNIFLGIGIIVFCHWHLPNVLAARPLWPDNRIQCS